MPTPNTYDYQNFERILGSAPNLFHQTSIKNLQSIFKEGSIYSPGTLWGIGPALANGYYQTNQTRTQNLKNTARLGFVDYVFCSFTNGIAQGASRYGVESVEVNKLILLERECFIYPFNLNFSWNVASPINKYSDISTWARTVGTLNGLPYNELLVRRKIDLGKYCVKILCQKSYKQQVIVILNNCGYGHIEVVSHDSPLAVERSYQMSKEITVEINNKEYQAVLSDDGKFASILNIVSEDDVDFLGRFEVDGQGNLVEQFIMSGDSVVVGKIKSSGGEFNQVAP